MRAVLLSLAVLVTSTVASAQPNVRDHRDTGPTEAPPPPQQEKFVPKHGQVWIGGQYEWRNGKWVWKNGHYEGRRKNKRWTAGHWDKQGDHFAWVAGTWGEAPKEQEAPPEVIVETEQHKRGYVWVKGYWQWEDGSYDWVPGHLEAHKKGKRFAEGHWDHQGAKWSWVAGTWSEAPKEPDGGPPAPPVEDMGKPRTGFVWVKGNYEWQDGSYEWVAGHWEREKAGKHWRDAEWKNVGGKWTFSAGAWE